MRIVEMQPDTGWVLNQRDNSDYVLFHICKGKADDMSLPESIKRELTASWRPVMLDEEGKIICSCCKGKAPEDLVRIGQLKLTGVN